MGWKCDGYIEIKTLIWLNIKCASFSSPRAVPLTWMMLPPKDPLSPCCLGQQNSSLDKFHWSFTSGWDMFWNQEGKISIEDSSHKTQTIMHICTVNITSHYTNCILKLRIIFGMNFNQFFGNAQEIFAVNSLFPPLNCVNQFQRSLMTGNV